MTTTTARTLALQTWSALGGAPAVADVLEVIGPEVVLPSAFAVTALATATTASAALAVAELAATRAGAPLEGVELSTRAAAAAFVSEALLAPEGWAVPPVWDPVAGDYRARDGWVRLHTNYAHHRAAMARALGIDAGAERDVVTAAVAARTAGEVEAAVVAAGGAAAAEHDRAAWAASAPGRAAAAAPLVQVEQVPVPTPVPALPAAGRALEGVRVLDLTRVIAGPECTRFLAAHGADVLRIDPPGFAEVPALLPETTVGKRCAALDLRSAGGRATLDVLVQQAHVLVVGYRPSSLDALGLGTARLRALQPALVVCHLDAYGWSGPWQGRRGFDSLVQLSTGITEAGRRATGADRPVPLPAQALDHGAGYLMAAVVARALTTLLTTGRTTEAWTSLVGMAELLCAHLDPDGLAAPAPTWTEADTVASTTAWGPLRRVPPPAKVAASPARWDLPAGPLGRDEPAFATTG